VIAMSKRPSMTITLPSERASQLRAIAAKHGLSLTKLLCKYIESEIRAGVILDEVPGLRVEVVNGVIEFELQGRTITLTKHEAAEIATALEQADPDCWLELENNSLYFAIRRRGRGLVVRFLGSEKMRQWSRKGLSASTIPWTRQGLSPSIAGDLARLFRTALKR
jgi:hypothetical protein